MTKPTFTIVLPCHNGGDYLKECVASVLAQDYDAFELTVLENGSTDGSLEWLQAIDDPRVRLYPSPLLTIEANWARAATIPKLEFMTLIGCDDRLDANYLRVMADLIERFPDAGLYHAHFRFIDKRGDVIRSCGRLPEQETAAGYIAALYTYCRDTYGTGYLMRSKAYDVFGGIPPFEGLLFADDALWIGMMQDKYKATAPEECFSCRLHNASAGRSAPWQSWLNSMRDYIRFLKKVAAKDPMFSAALAEFGPPYFMNYCQSLYKLAMVQATKQNRRVENDVAERLAGVLAEIAPDGTLNLNVFAKSRTMRLRRFINSSYVTRMIYNLFILVKHGEWKGRLLH